MALYRRLDPPLRLSTAAHRLSNARGPAEAPLPRHTSKLRDKVRATSDCSLAVDVYGSHLFMTCNRKTFGCDTW